ncbi:MFS transporter [Streptomyces inhibens]|uniref:MFS transporter n=1 Tax=Streptomyces inhibens TaxID=2293571 RepID=A0A371Q0S7_STRIH|nr:MFS transporter [Streptomyces inhibens]REK88241.1 MFS transporter [Streptomyces inhibens]
MSSVRHRRLTLVGSITGAVIVALDGTVLTVAQPTMQRALHASFVQVQWTSTGYLIAVASLLVFAGRLGDRFGHQQIFAIGILGFGATSAGIGLASDVGWVIGLRVAQGVFGALLQPATLGMLRATYPRDQLGMPLALRTSAIGLAAAAGPIVGGALAAHLGWRAVFFLNVAPALVIGVLALTVHLPTPAPTPTPTTAPTSSPATGAGASAARLDLPGACLLAITLVCLVHTLVAIPETGWTAVTTLGGVAAAVTCGAFIRHERRTASPLVPPSVLGSATVLSALTILLSASAALFGALFVGTYFLQDVLALDPLESGLRVLPLAVMMVLSAPASAVLQRRHGPRRTTMAAMVLLTLGILLLSQLDQRATPVEIGAGFLLLGAGFGTVMVTATAVIVHQASVDNAGVAGGLQQTAMNIGPTLGVAVATMLLTLTAPTAAGGRPYGGASHGGASHGGGSHGVGALADGPHWTHDAFVSAMGSTLFALAVLAAIGALAAIKLPRRLDAERTRNPRREVIHRRQPRPPRATESRYRR